MRYLILDCYPSQSSDMNQGILGASIGCWIKTASKREAEIRALGSVERQGWIVFRIIDNTPISEKDYSENRDGLKFYEQALVDEEVFHLHGVSENRIDLKNNHIIKKKSSIPLENYTEFIGDVLRGSALWTFFEKQNTVGFSLEQDEYIFPVFFKQDSILKWADCLNLQAKNLSLNHLKFGLIPKALKLDSILALELKPGTLFTVHPGRISDDFFGKSQS